MLVLRVGMDLDLYSDSAPQDVSIMRQFIGEVMKGAGCSITRRIASGGP